MTTKKSRKNKHLSPAKKAWITRKIKSGKTKYQTAKELGLPKSTVYMIAKNLPSKNCGWLGSEEKPLMYLIKFSFYPNQIIVSDTLDGELVMEMIIK
ncbi:MAG: hypothetical protein J7K62_04250 [Thermoplasmata archaeon]|nr:hypothetical protein [Thermoplasmata archaeon]